MVRQLLLRFTSFSGVLDVREPKLRFTEGEDMVAHWSLSILARIS